MNELDNIPLVLRAEIGSSMVKISRLLKVGRGGIIPLNRKEKDPILLKIGNVLIADGQLEEKDKKYVIKVEKIHYKL